MGLASRQAEPSSFAWRWPIAFQGVFCILILICLPFLPESPRWLVQHGRVDEATDVFARLAGKESNISDPAIMAERDEVVASVEEERKLGEASWGEVFTEGKHRNISRVLLGAGPYMYVLGIYLVRKCTGSHLTQDEPMVRHQLSRLLPTRYFHA